MRTQISHGVNSDFYFWFNGRIIMFGPKEQHTSMGRNGFNPRPLCYSAIYMREIPSRHLSEELEEIADYISAIYMVPFS